MHFYAYFEQQLLIFWKPITLQNKIMQLSNKELLVSPYGHIHTEHAILRTGNIISQK